MTPFLTRVTRSLLALLILTASAVGAEPKPDMAAARKTAAELLPKLESGSWQASETALQTIRELGASKEKADRELAEKLAGQCAAALVQGLQNLPPAPEQELLFWDAENLADVLLQHAAASDLKQARAIVDAWEKIQPDRLAVRLLRLRLHVVDNKREDQVRLAAALVDEKELSAGNRAYVQEVYVSARLRGKPSTPEELQQAETRLNRWLKQEPKNLGARLLLLELHHAKKDWQAQYALATELLKDEKLTGQDRRWVQHCRVEGALNTGKTHELNEQDWSFMLEQITGGKSMKQFIDKHGQLLLGIALGMGWLWFFIVAWITRSARAKPPGFWIVVLWATIILYASSVIMVPVMFRVVFSLLGLVFLIFATTGSRAPLGYLVAPQAATESGRARWRGVLGWCVLAVLLIHPVIMGYSWAFERLLGRELESQFVAKLLQTDTLTGLAGMVLAGGIFVPFLEEVIFRGLLQDWVGRRLSAGWCVFIVSALFGIIHGLEMAIPIAFIGVLLSILRLRYRSLWPCITLHALNNSLMIILLHFIPDKLI